MGEITDPDEFNSFIASLPIVGDSANVITRSGKGSEHPCLYCHHEHDADYICGPMVGMALIPPGPQRTCPDGRSQCEFSCWCEHREYYEQLNHLRAGFRAWRERILCKELNVSGNQLTSQMIRSPMHFGSLYRNGQLSSGFHNFGTLYRNESSTTC